MKVAKFLMGLFGILAAVAFFAVPAVKLKEPALVIVLLIGVAAMVWNFVETLREKDE